MHPTDMILERPWLAPALWAVLHGLDFGLTLVGARLRERRAREVIDVDGSYELNPIFQKPVDRGRWLSGRFLVTLLAIGGLLYLVAWAPAGPEGALGLGLLLGTLVFTRVAVIGRHLQNIWLFSRMDRRRDAVTGAVRYDRPTVCYMSSIAYAQLAVLLGVAAAVAPDPWIVGGALGNGLVAAYGLILGLVAARKASRAARSGPSPA